MRPVNVGLQSVNFSPWVIVDQNVTGFEVGLGFEVSSGGVLVANVEHTFDSPLYSPRRAVAVSQAANTITVTDTGQPTNLGTHGLSVGDWVHLTNTATQGALSMDGEYSVATVVSPTQYTLTSLVSQTSTGSFLSMVSSARIHPHAVMTGLSARSDGNYAFSIAAVRLRLTSWTSGVAQLEVRQSGNK